MNKKNRKTEDIIVPMNPKNYPVEIAADRLPEHLEEMAERLSERVIGQERPIRRALRYVTIYEAGLNDPKRPAGILMLAGPSGVGKTHFAKEFAETWIGPPKGGITPWVFIDCGSLSLEHERSSLTGSPPGYIGHGNQTVLEQVGQYERKEDHIEKINTWIRKNESRINNLAMRDASVVARVTRRVNRLIAEIERRKEPPRSVVIFDEIEKASKNIQRQLLSIMEEGRIFLHNGRTVDFRGSFLIFTTNVGTSQVISEYLQTSRIGFETRKNRGVSELLREEGDIKEINQKIYERVIEEISDPRKNYFLPEFLGRIGKPGIIVFHVLKYEHYKRILHLMLEEQVASVLRRAKKPDEWVHVSYTPALEEFLIQEGVSPQYGARALRSVIEKYVKAELGLRILNGDIAQGDFLLLDVEFEHPQEREYELKGASRIVVRRAERREGVDIKPVNIRKSVGGTPINIEQILDEYLSELAKELDAQKGGPEKKPEK